jgi:hypothetical protein
MLARNSSPEEFVPSFNSERGTTGDAGGYFLSIRPNGTMQCSCGRDLVALENGYYKCSAGWPMYAPDKGEVIKDKFGNILLKVQPHAAATQEAFDEIRRGEVRPSEQGTSA